MIYFMREKDFIAARKKLVEPKDYIIFDVSDDATGEMSKFANCVGLSGLRPEKTLVNLLIKTMEDNTYFEPDKVEKLEKQYLKSISFLKAIDMVFVAQGRKDQNIYVVFRNRDYKAIGKTAIQKFRKAIDADIIFEYEDLEKDFKMLRRSLTSTEQNALRDALTVIERRIAKKENEIEKEFDERDKKAKAKKKKKKEAAKKAKKKKKKDKWMTFLSE